MKRTLPLISLALLASFIIPTVAFASTRIMTTGTPVAHGGMQENLDTAVGFSVPMEAGRSYSCQVVGGASGPELSMLVAATETTSFRPCGAVTPANVDDTADNDNRWCMIAPTTQSYLFTVDSDRSGGEPARYECVETTIYGGYNTNANPFNFLEVLNLTNSKITFYVTAINWDGTKVIDAREYEVEANNRVDADLHTAAGAAKFGLVYVSHNGPYGALQGFVSQYRGGVGSLELATSIAMSPRDQNL